MASNRFAPLMGISWPLVWLGALGLLLAVGCTLVAAVRGLIVPTEGDLSKAITFNLAIGLYWLTLAVFYPLARFGAIGGRIWIAFAYGGTLYAYGIETIQTLRGIDPRFTRVGGPVDQIAGSVFGAIAMLLIAVFTVLAVKLVRRGTGGPEGLILLAFRYAIVATMIAFAAGIWMSFNQGRYTGAAGNILPLHAFGFHSLQAIPLVAWLFSRSAVADQEARAWVHRAGIAWNAACVANAWQTAAGASVTELSPAILAASIAVLAWCVCAIRAASAWRAATGRAVTRPAS